ncbi:hypothetical protein DPMN_118107 [Dreissena polymorpha]|uniref:Uncharacterized protein n=1 Tax=Dreissena polymorpha TaxID=45954 RepID=A0A9D4JN75_DREPO|nr:hypothetical protein DPMN_118107 [Dreissena polymorpha]
MSTSGTRRKASDYHERYTTKGIRLSRAVHDERHHTITRGTRRKASCCHDQ